jgi:hypothetical protein
VKRIEENKNNIDDVVDRACGCSYFDEQGGKTAMKARLTNILICMLVSTSLFAIHVAAHPPENVELAYHPDTQTLEVIITHITADVNNHFVDEVEVKKNDVVYHTETYTSQPTPDTFTYNYSVEAISGEVLTVTVKCNLGFSTTESITVGENNPPETPSITGRSSGKAGEEYEYTFVTTDPDGDNVSYCIDWGDETGEVCIGPYESGEEARLAHTWSEQGRYTIKVKARDSEGAESDPATLEVSMPKNKPVTTVLFRLLEWLAMRFPILKQFL